MRFPAASFVTAFVSTHRNHQSDPNPSSCSSSALKLMVPPAIPDIIVLDTTKATTAPASSSSTHLGLQQDVMAWLQETVGVPPAYAAAAAPPTNEEVNILQQAFAAFYGANRDAAAAEPLLTQTLNSWQRQPPDEQAGLYRVRGDCYMALMRPLDAIQDYSQAITLIKGPGGGKVDPNEVPAAYLGRARAIRSLHTQATSSQAQQAVGDYEMALKLSSREEWDTDAELVEDGARTNPYAAWEYGMALRLVGNYDQAKAMHTLASEYFDEIGDRSRSVISAFDAGIDVAASTSNDQVDTAKTLLKTAIKRIKSIEGRDIPLLQRVIAKEGEARLALASLYWNSNERPEAESQLGLACERLDQLEQDAIARQKANPIFVPDRLKFNIDDGASALDISCSRLKNKEYLTQRLEWPDALQQKANKLYNLSK